MTTAAMIGLGITLEMQDLITPNDWFFIAEVFNLNPPSQVDDVVEATHYGSPNRRREYIPGLVESGEVSFDMNYVPGSDSDVLINAAQGVEKRLRITFPNGVTQVFNGVRQGYEKNAPIDDRMTATVTFRVTGDVSQSIIT